MIRACLYGLAISAFLCLGIVGGIWKISLYNECHRIHNWAYCLPILGR